VAVKQAQDYSYSPTFVHDVEVHDEVDAPLRTCDPGCGPLVSLPWWFSGRGPRSGGLTINRALNEP
jgi:hypothetical protein